MQNLFKILHFSRLKDCFVPFYDNRATTLNKATYNHFEIELLSYLPVKEFSNIKESLEDYFMKFYKEDKDFGGAL